MDNIEKKRTVVVDKIVQEKMKLLEADPEFIELCELVPKVLAGKEFGKDFLMVTTNGEYLEKRKDKNVIVLSKRDWEKYERFERLCQRLAERYKLHWVTVEDLALGVEQPTVPCRLSRTITANLDPIVFLPKEFDRCKNYIARSTFAPPLEAIEVMKRVQQLDGKTKEEIKAYLFSLSKHIHGCRIVELYEQGSASEERKSRVELDVCLRVPLGYTASDVAQVYRKVDKRRRDILTSLGNPVRKRRRQSKILMKAESLELLVPGKDVGILGIVDEWFGDTAEEERRRRSIINKRYRGRKLLKDRLES